MHKLDVVRMLALLVDLGDCSKFIVGPSTGPTPMGQQMSRYK